MQYPYLTLKQAFLQDPFRSEQFKQRAAFKIGNNRSAILHVAAQPLSSKMRLTLYKRIASRKPAVEATYSTD